MSRYAQPTDDTSSGIAPIGGYIDVFGAGVNYKPVGSVLLRTDYPLLSELYPVSGIGLYAANYNPIQPSNINAIAHGNGRFVAVGQNGAVFVSVDGGLSWVKQIGGTTHWMAVIFSNNQFVICGGTSDCMTSPDGVTWTARTLPSTAGASFAIWRSLAFGNGKFVALAGITASPDQICATSADGITWTSQTISGGATYWARVTFGNGLFLATAQNNLNAAATSPDGVTWTRRALPDTGNWDTLGFHGGQFIAFASGPGHPETTKFATSSDAINWTLRQMPVSACWSGIAHGNGVFFAVAHGRTTSMTESTITATSITGQTFLQRVAPPGIWTCAAYGQGVFLAGYGSTTPASNMLRAYIEHTASDFIYLTGTAGKLVRAA